MPSPPPRNASERLLRLSDEDVDIWFEEDEELSQAPGATDPASVEEKYRELQVRVVRTSMDFTLHSLRHTLLDTHYINMAPDYQRRARWDRKKKSHLIESFLMNIPVPPIFLYENDYNQYEVMDGRQRLETVRDFMDNRFSLVSLDYWRELNGKTFAALPPTLQRGLLRRTLQAVTLLAETQQPTDLDRDIRLILFDRLNTGGVRLNAQELRNALYPGEFNRMIAKTARSADFTSLWRLPFRTPDEDQQPSAELIRNPLYKSMMDCEIVLRVFAIREMLDLGIRGSMRSMLDQCMKRHAGDDASTVGHLESVFNDTIRRLRTALGDDAFVLPAIDRLSRPLYDALMVAASRRPGTPFSGSSAELRSRLDHALTPGATYEILVGRANTADAIEARVRSASNILFGASA